MDPKGAKDPEDLEGKLHRGEGNDRGCVAKRLCSFLPFRAFAVRPLLTPFSGSQRFKHFALRNPICLRPLAPGEFDWELLVMGFLPIAGVLAWVWVLFQLPLPQCVFRAWTHQPCFSCGATTAVRLVFKGEFHAAFWSNPLFFCLMVIGSAIWIGSVVVVLKGQRRWRINGLSREWGLVLRAGVIAAVIANWVYLISK